MEQMPIELLEMIFDRLPIDELDKCRLVCKNWQFTIDRLMSFACLVVYRNFLPISQRHFPRNEMVSLRYCVHFDTFAADCELKRGIYRRFKRIFLFEENRTFADTTPFHNLTSSHSWLSEKTIKVIGSLNQIEELELSVKEIRPNPMGIIEPFEIIDFETIQTIHLSLPNLKSFKTTHLFDAKLILDAPQLTSLSFYRLSTVKLVHPESVETLEIRGGGQNHIFREERFCSLMAKLTGLKYLLVEDRIVEFVPETMRKHRLIECMRDRLKEIHFSGKVHFVDVEDRFFPAMKQLKEQATDIRIYFHGLEIDCLRNLMENLDREERYKFLPNFELATKHQRDLLLANYAACSETLPLYEISYSLVEDLVRSGHDLFSTRKLPKLERVWVDEQVKDELAFGRWLSGSDTLVDIVFMHAMSPHFNSIILPASCPILQGITLVEPVDLSFLFKLKFLERIEFISSDYGLVERLFSSLVYLRYLGFFEGRGRTRKASLRLIKKLKENQITYELYNGQYKKDELFTKDRYGLVNTFESFASLVEFLKGFTGF